jgi:alpha-tubulin suppressor-like RCC1 family protein
MQCLSAGEEHTAMVRSDGALFTCGDNSYGHLGHGDGEDTAMLTRVHGALLGKQVVSVSAGDYHTAAITDAGELFTWGGGGSGRLGHGDEEDRLVPTQVQGAPRGKHVLAVSGGYSDMAAVAAGGELYVWGSAEACGVGADIRTPREVSGLTVAAASAGFNHTAILTTAGNVYTFGRGVEGQLGHGDKNLRAVPTFVRGALQARVAMAVSAGFLSTAVLMQSGQLYTFGNEHDDGEEVEESNLPTLVAAPLGKRFVSASNAGYHTVATTGDGACYSWGRGVYGRLGHGDEEDCILPKQVEALAGKRVSAVAAGGHHSAAITTEGDLFTWGGGGSDYFPQLGLGTADDPDNSPTPVPCVGGIPWCTATPAAAGVSVANAAANAGNAGAAATTAAAHTGTAAPLPYACAALTTLMRGIHGTDVSALDDAALTAFDRRIARVHHAEEVDRAGDGGGAGGGCQRKRGGRRGGRGGGCERRQAPAAAERVTC